MENNVKKENVNNSFHQKRFLLSLEEILSLMKGQKPNNGNLVSVIADKDVIFNYLTGLVDGLFCCDDNSALGKLDIRLSEELSAVYKDNLTDLDSVVNIINDMIDEIINKIADSGLFICSTFKV